MKQDKEKKGFLQKMFWNRYIFNIAAMALVAVLLIGAGLFLINRYTRHNTTIEVPELKGLQVEDMSAILSTKGLKYEVVDSIYQKGGTPGSILDQLPKGKSFVKPERTIYLTVQAKTEPFVSIPNLIDASARQAETMLNAIGITHVNTVSVPSEFHGLVFGIEYNGKPLKHGDKIPKGSVVTIKVGDGNGGSSTSDSVSLSGSENFIE